MALEKFLVAVWLNALWTMVWKSLLFLIAWALLLTPLFVPIVAKLTLWEKTYPLPVRLYRESVALVTLLVAAWLMVRFVDRRAFSTLGFNLGSLGRDLILGLALGSLWLGVVLAGLWALSWLTVHRAGTLTFSSMALGALAMLINVVTQEVLARSYVLQVIQSQSNPVVAVLASAFIFMLYHAGFIKGAWLPALNVFLSGVVFGVAYMLTGNLWLPIGLHFAWNFLLGPGLGLAISGQDLGVQWQLLRLAVCRSEPCYPNSWAFFNPKWGARKRFGLENAARWDYS